MLLYAVLHPWVSLGFKTGGGRKVGGGGSGPIGWRWWFGKKKKGKATEQRDEAWVFDGS